MIQVRSIVILFALAICGVIGCSSGPKGVKVTGSVTMNSQPQDGVRVIFVSSDEKVMPQGAATGADGKFEAKIMPGTYRVTLARYVDKNGKVPGESEDPSQDFTQLLESGLLQQVFPPKYTSPDATPISAEIPPEGKDLEPFVVEK